MNRKKINRKRILWMAALIVVVTLQATVSYPMQSSVVYAYSVPHTTSKEVSKSASTSKTSSTNSFASSTSYSDADGYSGTLSKSGSSFVKSGSYTPSDTKAISYKETLSEEQCNYYNTHASEAAAWEAPRSYSSGGYTGTVYVSLYSVNSDESRTYLWSGTGTKPASDTRIYQQNYSGTVYKTVTETTYTYPKLSSIAVTGQPNKTRYKEGEDFDRTGLAVQATYVDGHTETTTGYTLSSGTNLAATTTFIRASYSDNGGTAYVDIPITVVKLTGIHISQAPEKTTYVEGMTDPLDLTGGELTLTYSDGGTEVIPLTSAAVVAEGTAIGMQNVKVTYKGFTDTYPIEVKQKSPVKLEITTPPDKMAYIEGLPFESAGMKAKVTYDNHTTAEAADFTITDGDSLQVTQSAVTVSYTENGATVTCQQPITVRAKQVSAITVAKLPDKLLYMPDPEVEPLDVSGGAILVQYDNATQEELPMDLSMISGFDGAAVGQQDVTVTYGGKSTVFAVKVLGLQGIHISQPPDQLVYLEGMTDSLDLTGGKLILDYEDGHTKEMDMTYATASALGTDIGMQTVEVAYKGFTDTYEIEVKQKSPVKIEVTTPPTKTEYIEELPFESAGMKVKVTYDNHTTAEAADFTITDGDSLQVTQSAVTVSYTENGATVTCQQPITVRAKQLVSIAVDTLPTKQRYRIDMDSLDTAGGKLLLTFDNATTQQIDMENSMVSGFDNTILGDQTLTVTYKGKTTAMTLTVVKAIGIRVSKLPDTVEYLEGMVSIDFTGGELTVEYEGGLTDVLPLTVATVKGYETAVGAITVTVAYDGFETTYQARVKAKSPVGIQILTPPSKLTYIEGNTFEFSGIEALITYNNHTTATAKELSSSDGMVLVVGQTYVTISYSENNVTVSCQQPITVAAKSPVKLVVEQPPNNVNPPWGEELDLRGCITRLYYNNGTDAIIPIEQLSISGYEPEQTGMQTVTVSSQGCSDTFDVKVGIAPITDITLVSPPAITTIVFGDELNPEGAIIKATRADGSAELVAVTKEMLVPCSMATGKQTVTIEYEKKQCTFLITITSNSDTGIVIDPPPNKEGVGDSIIKDDVLGKDDVEVSEGNDGTVNVKVNNPKDNLFLEIPMEDGKVARNLLNEEIPSFQDIIDGKLYVKITGDAQFEFIDNPKEFEDIENHWAKQEVERASAREIFAGMGENQFAPDKTMTVAMITAALHRLDGYTAAQPEAGKAWYEKDLQWAKEQQIAEAEDLLQPDAAVGRDQLAEMLYRFAVHSGIAADKQDAEDWMSANNIIIGGPDGELHLSDTATRAEVATMLNKSITTMLMHMKK